MGDLRLYSLKFALLVMGFSAAAFQILIIRELLIVFQGNELSIGVILGNWLLLEALGSYHIRRKAELSGRYIQSFANIQIALGICSILAIVSIRSFKYVFEIPAGELLGIHYVAVLSIIALAPFALLDGALFPLGCKNLSAICQREKVTAEVYMYQAIGAFAAGILFVFYLIYQLTTIDLTILLLILNLLSVIFYLTATNSFRGIRFFATTFLLASILFFVSSGAGWLHWSSSKILWHGYSLLDTKNSEYSNISVIKEEEQFTFFLNGSPYATSPAPVFLIEETAHFPVLFHQSPEKILVIGNGAGGLIRELLKYPMKIIDYAEPDPLVIEMFKKFPTDLTEYEINNENVNVHKLEGRLFLKKTNSFYDIILVNLPEPSSLQLNRYYTIDFFKLARSRLNENGILTLKVPGSDTFLTSELVELNRTIYSSLKTVFTHVRVIPGDKNLFIASMDEKIAVLGYKHLVERLLKKNIKTDLIKDAYIEYRMDKTRFGRLESEITAPAEKINQDLNPVGVFQSLLLLNLITSPFMVNVLKSVETMPFYFYLIAVCIFIISMIVMQHRGKKRLFIDFAIASTGFASMLLSIVLIFLFQINHGYIYHYIGLLTSIFMLGLAVGSFLSIKSPKTTLISLDAQLMLITMILYFFVSLKTDAGIISHMIIFGSMLYTGILTGMQYPVAVRLTDSSFKKVVSIGGRLYAIDLIGAFLGAVITAAILVPIFGIKNTLLLVLLIKAGSLFLVKRGLEI